VTPPDFERARQYALERLERELAASLTYHSLAHTRDEVVPATERLAAMEGVTGEPLLLLRTAAYFHDLGFVERRSGHEVASAQIAEQVLPGFGYSLAQIQAIRGMILATEIDPGRRRSRCPGPGGVCPAQPGSARRARRPRPHGP
jgi:uncharacterized protein